MIMAQRLLSTLLFLAGFSLNAAAQERQWTLDASDEDAYLIFGVADSDDVGVSLWCPIRKGVVNIFVPETDAGVTPGQQVTMTLSVGVAGETADIMARAEENLEAGNPSAEGQIEAGHPIFSAMIKADRFHVKVSGQDYVFPLFDADLEGLLSLCRAM